MSAFSGVVMTLVVKPGSGARGNSVGLEGGAGPYALLVEGDPEAAHALALERLRDMERKGQQIESVVLVRSDTQNVSRVPFEHVQLAQPVDAPWRPMDQAPVSTEVLLSFKNEYGHRCVALALYQPRFTVEAHWVDDEDACDYHAPTDTYYEPEGWYEQFCSHPDYSGQLLASSYEFLGWMPAPKPAHEPVPATEAAHP